MVIDDWDPDRMMNGSSGGGMYGGAWMMLALGLLLVAVLVTAIVTAIVIAFRATDAQRPVSATSPGPVLGSPTDVLDQRLARGEITPEEYRSTRSLLGR